MQGSKRADRLGGWRGIETRRIALGGKANGVPRETGFVITAASEIMAIMALASSRADLRRRLDAIVIGYDMAGQPVRAGLLKVTGAMMVVLADALLPNLVQTTENTPAIVHAGPFGNIAHGTSSVLAQRLCLAPVLHQAGDEAVAGIQPGPDRGSNPELRHRMLLAALGWRH